MNDHKAHNAREQERERQRKRMQRGYDPEKYQYFPETKPIDFNDYETPRRVAIYVRVSTDDPKQTTSFVLQQKYYEDYVSKHPNWTLVKIYSDEGKSGTNTAKRKGFLQMISDAKAGKIDLIITKSVSRFARNVVDFVATVRNLSEHRPPIGVFFESEAFFSLKEEASMPLTFLATIAEEESHTKSRSMETSLRMRLDNGVPLTPKLLGFMHDSDGQLIPNPEEAPTVKLAFFMYLYGYSTQQIANALIALERRSYLGNIKWTANGIVQILRNERHCGDILTRKTFTPNFLTHKSRKNFGNRPQSFYMEHHTGIISRDDFIAVQKLLDSAKYGNKLLPELRVIESGALKGYVIINPRWAGFKEAEYIQAACSVYENQEELNNTAENLEISVSAGDFDLRGFEITRSEFFDSPRRPFAKFTNRSLKFSTVIVREFGEKNHIELLINPVTRKFAIRPTNEKDRNAVILSKKQEGIYQPRDISVAAFGDTIYKLFDWNSDYKYRILGRQYEQDGEIVYVFDAEDSEAFLMPHVLPCGGNADSGKPVIQPVSTSGHRIRAIPEEWTSSFGKQFYIHEQSLVALENQREQDWKLRMEGRLFETGNKLNVTPFEELQAYIRQELNGISLEEVSNE